MNLANFSELENLVFKIKQKPLAAANMAADFLGVLIDLKPAAAAFINKEELNNANLDALKETCSILGLFLSFDQTESGDALLSISKDKNLGEELEKAFLELHRSLSERGKIQDREKWVEQTRRIGRLLGYPCSAVEYYISGPNVKEEDYRTRMKRNRYYAHSPEHENAEFEQYDKILNENIEIYAPGTTKVFKSNPEKRRLK